MAGAHDAVKKSVTIDLAALDAQRSLVEEWEAEHGGFSEEELRPYLEAVIQAEMESDLLIQAPTPMSSL